MTDTPQAIDTHRNLVLCLDGTANEPESGSTNVARLFDLAVKDDSQLTYYDPGVGTMGARGAVTRLGKTATRWAGLIGGHGVKENLEEAYTFLMQNYRRGDRIFVIGFSRGAYTGRALTGMLRTVGLLRPGTENLVPYAVKLYAASGPKDMTEDRALGVIHPNEKAWWLLGGWRTRPVRPTDSVHPSVRYRIEHTAGGDNPYGPALPS